MLPQVQNKFLLLYIIYIYIYMFIGHNSIAYLVMWFLFNYIHTILFDENYVFFIYPTINSAIIQPLAVKKEIYIITLKHVDTTFYYKKPK